MVRSNFTYSLLSLPFFLFSKLLLQMQKSQILQEYLFMERVNAFLEEKLLNLPVPPTLQKLLDKQKKRKQHSTSSSENESKQPNSSPITNNPDKSNKQPDSAQPTPKLKKKIPKTYLFNSNPVNQKMDV